MNLFLIFVMAVSLPSFEDFRRIDRTRRFTGQMLTAELLRVSQIDANLILRTAQEHADDPKIIWGSAELLVDWPSRRKLYELALAKSATNTAMAVRFACAAAQQHDYDAALAWLHECQKLDADNTAPWLAELWMLREQGQSVILSNSPPIWTTNFRDYSADASRTRIRTLETAGYSPYAARRLGFSPDSPALSMARDLCKPPIGEQTARLLKDTAQAMQRRPPFLLWEFVGQTIERSLLTHRADATTSVEARYRGMEMDKRREELKELLGDVEHNTVEFATEEQMVQYFDDVLDAGEEAAIKRLATAVRAQPSAKETLRAGSAPGIFAAREIVRTWRNWQTRSPQKAVTARSWRFDSSRPHQIQMKAAFLVGLFLATSVTAQFLRPIDPRRPLDANGKTIAMPTVNFDTVPQPVITEPVSPYSERRRETGKSVETKRVDAQIIHYETIPGRVVPHTNFAAKRAVVAGALPPAEKVETSRADIKKRVLHPNTPAGAEELKQQLRQPQ